MEQHHYATVRLTFIGKPLHLFMAYLIYADKCVSVILRHDEVFIVPSVIDKKTTVYAELFYQKTVGFI